MLKKIAAKAETLGYDVEIYHCGFDPNSLDMVICREIGVAIFDSTAPHEHFPDRATDKVVDMYTRAIKPGTDEKYADKISEIQERYSAKMKEATSYLAKAKELHDQLENIYIEAVDFNILNIKKEEVNNEIIRFEEKVKGK